jgi:uncharacterized RDD family membrane protein YckC
MSPGRTHALLIETPEGVSFSLLLAGPVTRFLAWIIDLFAILAVQYVVQHSLAVTGILGVDVAEAAGLIGYFAISTGYGICLEWLWRGQTPGKRVLRLRVMDVQGLRLEFSQIVIRNLLRVLDLLPLFYMVGGVACLVTRNAQRLGDLAANTIVVRSPQIEQPDLDRLLGGKFNSLLEHRQLAARLRQRASPQSAGIALNALLRRDEFEPRARVELFDRLTAYFQELVEFPPEAVESMTSEQYVRNVIEILFRTPTSHA